MADTMMDIEVLRTMFEHREQYYVGSLLSQREHELMLQQYQINHTELRIMAFLLFHGDSEPSVIADQLLILRQAMTKIVDHLEAQGLVSRSEHPSDRRKVFVHLLPQGQERTKEILSLDFECHRRMREQFSPEEMDIYLRLSTKMQYVRKTVIEEMIKERFCLEA